VGPAVIRLVGLLDEGIYFKIRATTTNNTDSTTVREKEVEVLTYKIVDQITSTILNDYV
jgi:hypothetical protein